MRVVAADNCSSCVSPRAAPAAPGCSPRAPPGSRSVPPHAGRAWPEGESAANSGSLRRTTRTACRKESRSGSSSARSAASCISPRTAKCASSRPQNSCRTSSGVLLRSTTCAPRRCVFNSARAPSISQRSWDRREIGGTTAVGYFRARSLTEGGYVAWVLRLVEIGAEGEGSCADVVEISRPDGLVDIADLGLTLAEAKLVLAGVQREIVAAQARVHAMHPPACRSCGA